MSNEKEDEKTTSEKPVTLSPLKFKEALKGLLKVKPKPKESEMVEAKEPNEED